LGVHPTDPLRELTALPRPPSWIKGSLLLRDGEGRAEGAGRERRGGLGETE